MVAAHEAVGFRRLRRISLVRIDHGCPVHLVNGREGPPVDAAGLGQLLPLCLAASRSPGDRELTGRPTMLATLARGTH